MSLSSTSAPGGPPKVAIPKLPSKRNELFRKPGNSRPNRVTRACLTCRARKIKCNGAKPSCANCAETSTACVYSSSRKDRLKTFVYSRTV
ncbi:hypothetical protein BDU57DRAFT_455895 [Ampelomyces quisqualis]|uniref:Zn(2)-C6 fungal-type domain-containing protein n=1 Tax=Ampelomyces quisqualis TaxID=50730 RepID=A0A6A5QI69_AMPQU|nr:hypothetical protein BDU57DRAFT_455895 [Ampelomyces quisqualis]